MKKFQEKHMLKQIKNKNFQIDMKKNKNKNKKNKKNQQEMIYNQINFLVMDLQKKMV